MRVFRRQGRSGLLLARSIVLAGVLSSTTGFGADKPTGAPLVLSSIETEQPIPLVYLDPDGKTAHCTPVKIHWAPNAKVGPNDDSTSFTIDLPAENPAAPMFTAQLWNASLASALAWQQPWQGASWQILQVPATDGTGIDAGLAVGMISTSARRPYPDKTAVIGSLNPDGSLGPVSKLVERLNAAAAAGVNRVIIPNVQRFDTDATGQVVNLVRHAVELKMECLPVDTLIEATETAMNDPLPPRDPSPSAPHYSNDVTSYIDDFARREQNDVALNMKYAPAEADLARYPARQATQAALWKSAYADYAAGQQSYRAGQVYVAWRLFCRANATMTAVNTLVSQGRASFDVKAALEESETLHNNLHALMNPPAIDKGELESAVLVAEMADWAYDINAMLEGAQLVTKQTFSARSDATEADKDRAREAILIAIQQAKRLIEQAPFYNGLLPRIAKGSTLPVEENASRLLPQLVPAQLATARIFSDGIRARAEDLRVGLLFDPRLVAYINVLKQSKADWDSRLRKKEQDAAAADAAASAAAATAAAAAAAAHPSTNTNQVATPVKPGSETEANVAFDPGQSYSPPHASVSPTQQTRKLSDVALCLIWVNNDCEIATLDEKYLRLNGIIDPATHEWHVRDRPKLDALLQSAEAGARQGIAFAEKAEIDTAVLGMIYERAAHLRIQSDDASALEALRQYWRVALLGNMCWQLAHTRKAQPVDLTPVVPPTTADKSSDKNKDKDKDKDKAAVVKPKPTEPAAPESPEDKIPVAPIAHGRVSPPRALPVVGELPPPDSPTPEASVAPAVIEVPAPAPAPTPAPVEAPIPVVHTPANPAIVPEVVPDVRAPEPPPKPPKDDGYSYIPPAPLPPKNPPPKVVTVPKPPKVPAPTVTIPDEANIPVAPIAHVQDYAPRTNAAPRPNYVPRSTPPPARVNADGDSSAFP